MPDTQRAPADDITLPAMPEGIDRGFAAVLRAYGRAAVKLNRAPVPAAVNVGAAQAETALTEDQWLDLGMRHAGRNLDGSDFLKFIKAVCRDYDAARATPGATHGN